MNEDLELPPAEPTQVTAPKRRWLSIGAAGLVAGVLAIGVTTVAGAQGDNGVEVDDTGSAPALSESADVDGDDHMDLMELTAEEEAAFAAFDQCLIDNGVDAQVLEMTDADLDDIDVDGAITAIEADIETLDAAFEACESHLDGIDFGDMDFDEIELSPEDEAVFEAFDQCLVDNGLDEAALDAADEAGELTDADFEAIDAAFETCEPILDGLSDDAMFYLDEDCDDYDDIDDLDEFDDLEDLDEDGGADDGASEDEGDDV